MSCQPWPLRFLPNLLHLADFACFKLCKNPNFNVGAISPGARTGEPRWQESFDRLGKLRNGPRALGSQCGSAGSHPETYSWETCDFVASWWELFPENVAGKETVAFLRFWCNLYLHWATLLAATSPFQRQRHWGRTAQGQPLESMLSTLVGRRYWHTHVCPSPELHSKWHKAICNGFTKVMSQLMHWLRQHLYNTLFSKDGLMARRLKSLSTWAHFGNQGRDTTT